jgi:hypothetical protein
MAKGGALSRRRAQACIHGEDVSQRGMRRELREAVVQHILHILALPSACRRGRGARSGATHAAAASTVACAAPRSVARVHILEL